MSKKKKDWKTEKERLLRLDREERRKEYRRQDFIPLDKIPAWREENGSNDKEELPELAGGGGLSDKVSLYKGDITVLEVDAIVNAANSSLLGGGGVDGCIHKAAGSCLYDECQSLNGCETGKAKITGGYDLPARYVIHTVGPVARGHVGPRETNDLTSCYQNSLRLVKEHGLTTVAFPCISTGIYGFPNEPAAGIALNTVKSWIEENPEQITRVVFCVFLETDFTIYRKKLSLLFRDDTPPSPKSPSKEGCEDAGRGKEETGDEECDEDGDGNADVEMASQTQDDPPPNVEPSQEKCDDQPGNQDGGEDVGTDSQRGNSGQEGISSANEEGEAEEEQSAAKLEAEDADTSSVAMEDVSDTNSGTSNPGDSGPGGVKDEGQSSKEPASLPSDSVQAKDPAEKKE